MCWLIPMDFFHFFVEGVDWKSTLFGAVVGAIVSVLIQAIIKLFKPGKSDYHLSLDIKGGEKHFSSLESDDVSINVKYRGVSIEGEMAVLEIELYNDGRKAISFANHFNRPIYLKSDDYTIVSAKAVDSEKVGAKISKKEDGTICISWDLLKSDESIRLQLIGQRKDETKKRWQKDQAPFYNSLKFNVRSDCVDYLVSGGPSIKKMIMMMVIGVIIMAVMHIFLFIEPEKKNYKFQVKGEIATGVLVYDRDNDVFVVQQVDSLTVSDGMSLVKQPNVELRVSFIRGRTVSLIINYLGFIILIIILGIIVSLSNKHNDKRKAFDE